MKIVCVYKNICLIFQGCVEKAFSLHPSVVNVPVIFLYLSSSSSFPSVQFRASASCLPSSFYYVFFVAVLHCHIQAWPILYTTAFWSFSFSLWMIDSCSTVQCCVCKDIFQKCKKKDCFRTKMFPCDQDMRQLSSSTPHSTLESHIYLQ